MNGQAQVQVGGLGSNAATLSPTCLQTLNWPLARSVFSWLLIHSMLTLCRVDNTKREDIVFIGFSIWVLGMSLVAVLNESPPHMYVESMLHIFSDLGSPSVASFLTHMLATAWSAFQLVNTQQFHGDFSRLTTRGACGVNLLPTYWSARAKAEIPTLSMNVLALLISAYLSWRLMKVRI